MSSVADPADQTSIEYVPSIGRRARVDSWETRTSRPTARSARRSTTAAGTTPRELANYFVDEAQGLLPLYRQWIPDLERVPARERRRAEDDRPASTPTSSPSSTPPRRHAVERRRAVGPLPDRDRGDRAAAIHREQRDEAPHALDEAKETLAPVPRPRRRPHLRADERDRRRASARRRSGACTTRCSLPLFVWRYEKFDIDKHPWDDALETLMLVACEAMRGHLVGPSATGDMELIEPDDRYILRFDPCGSGGSARSAATRSRARRRAWRRRTTGRSTEEPHTWNHYTAGRLPLLRPLHRAHGGDADGPLRLPGPRHRPAARTGHDADGHAPEVPVADVQGPDEGARGVLRARAGARKPDTFGSKAHGAAELPYVTGMPGAG